MKSNFILFIAFLSFSAIAISCKKDGFRKDSTGSNFLSPQEKNEYQVQFSKTLAKAIKEESSLRTFIKTEALKQFDDDYDVLFQMVKDTKVDGQLTFYDVLAKHADEKDKFDLACNRLPLLTIYVPTLPDWSVETWNADTQIPVIAIEPDRQINSGKVSLYNDAGKYMELSTREVPGFPVVVVKDNERVILSTTKGLKPNHVVKESVGNPFFTNENFSYKFWDNSFDNFTISNKNSVARSGINDPLFGSYTIDKVNVDAYNSGSEWQRDFVYYGITPSMPDGVFTIQFSEFITSFSFIRGEDLDNVSDQANDPKGVEFFQHDPVNEVLWTEGRFEFRLSVFINAKNGVGQELKKVFSAGGSDLFTLQYEKTMINPWLYVWVLTGATPKQYNPNVELVPWDLENYGTAWKFAVSEYDPVEEHTRTVTNTTTFAGNFEINLSTGEKIKKGAKFGGSGTWQTVTQYQYKYTTGNDDFGEGVLDFRTPVITSLVRPPLGHKEYYTTYEVTTGTISMSVEPKRIY